MPESSSKRLEIKKYANRRYYDATHSRHLTLEEIRALIQQGYDISVVDSKSSTDITAQVLTQLILELDTSKVDSLPVPLLVRIIRMNDQLVKDFIEKYFNQALQSFLAYQQRLEEQVRQAHGLPSTLPLVSAWTKAMLEPFSSAFGNRASEASPGSQPPSPDHVTELEQTVRALKSKVMKLQRRAARRHKASSRAAKVPRK